MFSQLRLLLASVAIVQGSVSLLPAEMPIFHQNIQVFAQNCREDIALVSEASDYWVQWQQNFQGRTFVARFPQQPDVQKKDTSLVAAIQIDNVMYSLQVEKLPKKCDSSNPQLQKALIDLIKTSFPTCTLVDIKTSKQAGRQIIDFQFKIPTGEIGPFEGSMKYRLLYDESWVVHLTTISATGSKPDHDRFIQSFLAY